MTSYQEFLKNQEYISYKNQLQEISFDKKLKYLAKKYKNKKILIYGNGILFDAICKNYNIKDCLDIVAISDIRYEKQEIKEYLNFKTVKPKEIINTEAQVILIATINPKEMKKFLLKNNLAPKNAIIEPFIQELPKEKFEKFKLKLALLKEYFLLTKNILKSSKYLFSLNEIEIQTKINYQKVINKLKKEKRKIKVAFLCEENAKWGYQSVYDELIKDENFEVLPIINLPILTYVRQELTQENNKKFFDSFNMDSIDGFDYEKNEYKSLKDFQPDIVFYQQPWYMINSQHPKEVSKYALCAIVSYGLTSIDVDSWGSQSIKERMGNIWKMFCESNYHNKFYQKASLLKNKDITTTTGYPKLDSYQEKIDSRFEKLWKDKNHTHPRIIWAPHHSIENYGFQMSNFKEHYQFFLNFAKSHKEYRFIFKPHPVLRHKCISEKFMSEIEFDNYINEWNELENASVYNEGNYFDIFKSSDVLITDSSSFLAEYFYSTKPIIFLDNKNRAGFNEFGKKIKKYFYIPKDLSEIESLLNKLLIQKIDPMLNKRIKLANNIYYYPKLGIGKRIVDYIKKELDLK